MAPVLPADAEDDLREIMAKGRPFHVELDGAQGRVTAWKITLLGRSEPARKGNAADWAPQRSLTIRKGAPQTGGERQPSQPDGPK